MSAFTCVICGTQVLDAMRKGKYCWSCGKHVERIQDLDRKRIKKGCEPFTHEQWVEMVQYYKCKDRGDDVIPPEYSGLEIPNKRLTNRCLYCGGRTNNAKYCTRCTKEGFASLHMATGHTNGWDRYTKNTSNKTNPNDYTGGSNFYKSHTRSIDETR